MTKRGTVKEIAQFAKIEGLCIAAAMLVYTLHSICTFWICKKHFPIGCSKLYRRMASFFLLGWAFKGIGMFFIHLESTFLLCVYVVIFNTLWVGVYFGAVLFLSARLIRHDQINAKKLVLPVVGSGVLVCVLSGLRSVWVLLLVDMDRVQVCEKMHTSMHITAPIIWVVLCILIFVYRSTGRFSFVFGRSNIPSPDHP